MDTDREDEAPSEDEAAQRERLEVELETADEHLEQEGRDSGRGEDLDGRMDTDGEDEEPPPGSPEHDRGIISGS